MKFGVIGSGSWGTALVKILTDVGHDVTWCVRSEKMALHIQNRHHNPKYLSSVYFSPDKLSLTTDPAAVYDSVEALVLAVPSAYAEGYILPYKEKIHPELIFISAVKGMLPEKNILLNEYMLALKGFDVKRYVTIMGPCHAEEVAAEKLSYLTFAGIDSGITQLIASSFSTPYINTIVSHDVTGVQYAAVLKNIYAMGAGISHGLGYGDNFLSVFIANAAGEMKRFLNSICDAKSNTSLLSNSPVNYSSSVYLGDLLVTCYSLFSRNRSFGNMIGKGYSVESAQLAMQMVAEGMPASKSIYMINASLGVSMPIAQTIYRILWEGLDPAQGFQEIESAMQ
ncbi:MAG: NAD(P)H-dependent glycerol-3-phosphate dehydrogenase [bacterium]